MSFPYDNRTHYTQQGDRRNGLTVYAGPTLSGRRIGRLREPRSLALVVLRSFCQQGSTAWQPVSGRPTRAAPPASVTVELTLRRRYAYVDSTQRDGHRVGHPPSRSPRSIRK